MSNIKAYLDEMLNPSQKKKKLFFLIVSTILVVGIVIAIAAGVSSHKNGKDDDNSPGHAILKSSCSNTRYPELCFSVIASVPGAKSKLSSQKDVIQLSLNLTITAVEHNYFTIKKIIRNRKSLTNRQKTALHDCLENVDETLDELHDTKDELEEYYHSDSASKKKKKSLTGYADDLKTLLSSAMTNQDSCLDGFSSDAADKKVRKILEKDQVHVYHMVSNALAMISNMTDADVPNHGGRKLLVDDSEGFPKWMSVGDRRLLQSMSVTPDVVVAADGSGDYTTVEAAVAAAPEKRTSDSRYIIRIKAGVYRENVEVPKKKTYLMFVGDGRTTTIITASRNVVDGSTTFKSATVAVVGAGFLARDITFENTAGPSKHQAVAFRSGADLSAFYRCNFLAYQDTLYVHSNRQFYVKCHVAGTVDFIFGNAAAMFQDCDLRPRRPNSGQKNMLTAQGRDDPNQNTGIVIHKCRIGATSELLPVQSDFPTYLGRPWKEYSRTVVLNSEISDVIHPAGWHEWNGEFALSTLYYAEYQNTGAGAGTSGRVKWEGYRELTAATDVQPFTVESFLGGNSWLGSTGFPFTLGL